MNPAGWKSESSWSEGGSLVAKRCPGERVRFAPTASMIEPMFSRGASSLGRNRDPANSTLGLVSA